MVKSGERLATVDNESYFNQLTQKVLEENVSTVDSLIEVLPDNRRKCIRRMMESDLGTSFFVAPASSRRSFHSAYPGGLVVHSLNVVRNGLALSKSLAPKRWADEKIVFCCLFHDLAKAVAYKQNDEQWKWKRGEFYDTVDSERMQSGAGSLYLLQKHGIVLDYDETMAIELTDGPQNFHTFKEPALSLIVGWADRWAMQEEKESDR